MQYFGTALNFITGWKGGHYDSTLWLFQGVEQEGVAQVAGKVAIGIVGM